MEDKYPKCPLLPHDLQMKALNIQVKSNFMLTEFSETVNTLTLCFLLSTSIITFYPIKHLDRIIQLIILSVYMSIPL